MKMEICKRECEHTVCVLFADLCDGQVFICPKRNKHYIKIVNPIGQSYNCIRLDNFVLTGFTGDVMVNLCNAKLTWEME